MLEAIKDNPASGVRLGGALDGWLVRHGGAGHRLTIVFRPDIAAGRCYLACAACGGKDSLTLAPSRSTSAEGGAAPDHISIQYYLHFFSDVWGVDQQGGHRHEGDWEVFQILLDKDQVPYRAATTQQWQLATLDETVPGGEGRDWADVERMHGARPVLYVGQGGNSLYFEPGATRYEAGSEVHDGLGFWLLASMVVNPCVSEVDSLREDEEVVAAEALRGTPVQLAVLFLGVAAAHGHVVSGASVRFVLPDGCLDEPELHGVDGFGLRCHVRSPLVDVDGSLVADRR